MIPPTPTPMPTGAEVIDIGSSYSLWGGAQTAVQTWNWMGTVGTVIQVIILILLVWAGIAIVQRFIKEYTRKDAES